MRVKWLMILVSILLTAVLVACGSTSTAPEATATTAPTVTAIVSPSPEPTPTPLPTPTPTPVATPTPLPRLNPLPIGATADWTATDDLTGIDGTVTVNEDGTLTLAGFVFLAAEAPGVDIRLGVDGDYSDEESVSLRDITGKTYEGRSLTLTLPDEAYDGRRLNSIGVVCYNTGDVFDSAQFSAE
ncbi:MAG: hypothetical protein R3C44_23295 [Chloroflexota bacterium]